MKPASRVAGRAGAWPLGLRRLFVLAALLILLDVRADAPGLWTLDPGVSAITFEATQAGARFEGRFETFAAEVRFDPEALDASSAEVRIDTASVATGNRDRDATLEGEDFFAVRRFPTATYVADAFEPVAGGRYRAFGQLRIRDVTRDVPLVFSVSPQGEGWLLEGTAKLSRLDFGLGASGDWSDTRWVGDEVAIRVRVLASAVSDG
ncbi:MAG TPA: YceI family protein [Pseudomonadales bacterium]|nr:YceI family protein [Pseudomonadales bacterium]